MNSDVISDAILPPLSFTNQHESELESVPERWTAAGSGVASDSGSAVFKPLLLLLFIPQVVNIPGVKN